MIESQNKYSETRYTQTAALLALGLVFGPAVLFLSLPLGYRSVSLAVVCGSVFAALARLSWTRHSLLTIPSIGSAPQGNK